MADEQPPAEQQPQEQQFYRQYLQSTAPDGSSTIREIVSPNLLDADAATAAEQRAGYTFQNFVDPAKMRDVPPAQAAPAPPPEATPLIPSEVQPTAGAVPASYRGASPVAGPWAQWQAGMPDAVANPEASPWFNMLPPAAAVAAPMLLTAVAPEAGIPALMAAAAFGGGSGEAGRQYLAGEPFSLRSIATQGATSGLTEGLMTGVVNPYVLGPVARQVTGRLGQVGRAAEDLGPVLTTKGTTVTAPAASAPPPPLRVTGLHTLDLANSTPEGMQILAKQATAAERPALAGAWVAARRAEAFNSGDPVQYMKGAYAALGPETQQALFGAQKGAFERVLGAAWGGTPEEISALVQKAGAETGVTGAFGAGAHYAGVPLLHVPTTLGGLRTLADFSAPFAARSMLVSPGAARFGAGLSRFGGVAAPAVSDLAAQTVAERARQAGLPTF